MSVLVSCGHTGVGAEQILAIVTFMSRLRQCFGRDAHPLPFPNCDLKTPTIHGNATPQLA